ncbi:MAG: transglycosylase domain-containing protein [Candidatus Delongbacteria bacterium]|nr:transglycosylase domain-containing protein [Candidatus Delongbacteria bacterium]
MILCIAYNWLNPPYTPLMLYRKLVYQYQSQPRNFIPIASMDSVIPKMVVSIEDDVFYEHWGINIKAIRLAYHRNRRAGYSRYGASTITQQTARTLFLLPHKLWLRKYLEMIVTLEMELVMPKSRILELYLNYAEWGKGVYGIGAAARYHYKKEVKKLSREEIIRLVVILSSPIKYNPSNYAAKRILRVRYNYLHRLY